MAIRYVLSVLGLLCGVFAATAAELPIKKGESFPRARSVLVREGWKPIETFARQEGELEHFHFGAREIYQAGFKEVESCMGTGSSPCFYNYHKGDQCLFLIAEGEYDRKYRDWARVTGWWLYSTPSKMISASRPQYPFCSEDGANKTRPHTSRPY